VLAPLAGLPVGGHQLLLLVPALVLTGFAMTGLGFLVAWPMDSTQGFHAIMNIFLMPLWMMSGALFPMPVGTGWLHLTALLNPVSYGVTAIRAAFAAGPGSALPEGYLSGLGVTFLFRGADVRRQRPVGGATLPTRLISMSTFLQTLRERVLCGDGAIGTLLAERGVPTGSCFEELCTSRPDLISSLHTDYLAAGAEILTTDSFGANALKLAAFGLQGRVTEINRAAAALAKKAVADSGKTAWVAGSVGPLGLQQGESSLAIVEREAIFREQIAGLLEGGRISCCWRPFRIPGNSTSRSASPNRSATRRSSPCWPRRKAVAFPREHRSGRPWTGWSMRVRMSSD